MTYIINSYLFVFIFLSMGAGLFYKKADHED